MSSNDEFQERVVMQLEMITSLLSRLAFGEDLLIELVTKGSRKPDTMAKMYNLCTGALTITEISRKVGMNQSSVTRAVNRWEEVGILYKRRKEGSVYPIRLYPLRG